MNWWIIFALDDAICTPSYPASRAHAAQRPNCSAISRISSVVRTCNGTPRSAGRTWTGGFDTAMIGAIRVFAYVACQPSIA
jgi:hypothetical protein